MKTIRILDSTTRQEDCSLSGSLLRVVSSTSFLDYTTESEMSLCHSTEHPSHGVFRLPYFLLLRNQGNWFISVDRYHTQFNQCPVPPFIVSMWKVLTSHCLRRSFFVSSTNVSVKSHQKSPCISTPHPPYLDSRLGSRS